MSTVTRTDPGTLLMAALDSAGLGVAVIDQQCKIAFVNQKARTIWGDSFVQGTSFLEWRRPYRVQDRQGRDIPIDQAFALRALAGEELPPRDLRVVFPDGSVSWLHAITERFSVLGITGVLIIVQDETEQVLMRRAVQELEQLKSLGHLTRGIIHDLNNMFSVANENLYLARTDEGVPQPTRERLQQTEVALKKGIGLVKKLGQFSRPQDFQPHPFPINHAVHTAIKLARPLFGSRIRVQLALHPHLPKMEGDACEVEQALVNLILNAVDAMPKGGQLSLSTELVNREANGPDGEEPGNFVVVTVTDTGVGIPEDIRPRIFEPFFTTKTDKNGTGLGLARVFGIVQQHHGEIKVDSVPGKGTRFTIYFPVSKRSSAVPRQEREAV